MPLVAEDLLAPRGELQPALLAIAAGTQAAADVVTDWLDAGYDYAAAAGFTDAARVDRIARAYAYWRAYDAAVQAIAASPMSVSFVDKGSSTFTSEQLRTLQSKATQWQAEYDAAITLEPTTQASGASTTATPNRFVW